MRDRLDPEGERAWQALIEEPLGNVIEQLISDDLIRGVVFTDARIGVSTFPDDPTLLQNLCFLYHIIGRGTGEWRVPIGGMGALVNELTRVANSTGRVTFVNDATVKRVSPSSTGSSLSFDSDEKEQEVDARFVLCNASSRELSKLLREENNGDESIT